MNMIFSKAVAPSILIFLALGCSSCGLLLGNVKPLSGKSSNYSVTSLSKIDPRWKTVRGEESDFDDGGTSDRSYQSSITDSIVALNSSCRNKNLDPKKSLRDYTDLLILGMSPIEERTERKTTVSNQPALGTTLVGFIGGKHVKMQTVVMRNEDCIFDFMYLTSPEKYKQEISQFSSFIASFKLD